MTQVSRPFQVVLAVFAVFVVVWFAALRNHSLSTDSGSGSSPSVAQPAKSAKPHPAHARTAAVHTTVVHVTRVHTHASAVPAKHASAVTVKHASAVTVKARPAVKSKSVPAKSVPAKSAPAKTLSPEAQVESQLKAGKTVLILFWNPHGAEDAAVHGELPAVQRHLGGKVAVHYASAGQLGEYGTVTHAVQINQTPTLVIVNPHGQATVLTGLTDAFAIEQAVTELK